MVLKIKCLWNTIMLHCLLHADTIDVRATCFRRFDQYIGQNNEITFFSCAVVETESHRVKNFNKCFDVIVLKYRVAFYR